MKLKTPNLFMAATLLCMLYLTSCQKVSNVLPQSSNANDNRIPKDLPHQLLKVPLAGNAFITKPSKGGSESITSLGLTNWTNYDAVISTYFRLGKTGDLSISLNASVPTGTSSIKVTINGQSFTLNNMSGNTEKTYNVAVISIKTPGYVKVDLQGVSNSNKANFADVSNLVIFGTAAATDVNFANDANRYNDSRAGAALKLQYNISQNAQWFYNELTVPIGSDQSGSEFISNGFDGGKAGLITTVSGEKRIAFEVFNTSGSDARLLRSGAGTSVDAAVTDGKYVYLPSNWTAGTTYKFLTQANPDGNGNTTYSTWVYTPEDNQWKFIASCCRANAGNYLIGLYSSLQGTNPENGFMTRRVRCYNQWTNTNGTWTEVTSATFKGDATASNNQRLDYSSSVEGCAFYLKDQGFFSDFLPLNSNLTRTPTANPPSVDLNNLP